MTSRAVLREEQKTATRQRVLDAAVAGAWQEMAPTIRVVTTTGAIARPPRS